MDELKKFAEKFTEENGIENYEINLEGSVAKGENYLGEVIFFNITPRSGPSYHFIRKKAKCSKDSQERTAIKIASQREFYLYNEVFPTMREFLKRHKHEEALNIIPKVYCIEDKEEGHRLMILENMKHSGYQMLDKKFPMNPEKASLVIETYAKFHSISLIMKELEPHTFKKLAENMIEIWSHFKSVFSAENYFAPLLRDVLSKQENQGRSDLVMKYKPIEDDIENVVFVEVEEEDRIVVIHGDAWNNNMLLKNDEQGSPKSVCLIDFQLSSVSTPVLDLCQFLLSAGDKDVLADIEKYLKLYHRILTESLEKFNIDIQRVFTFEKLMEQWKKYAKCGIVLAVSTIQVSLAEAEEIPEDFHDMTYSDSSKMKNSVMFNERMNDLLINFGGKYL